MYFILLSTSSTWFFLPASCLPCDMDIQRALWWLLWLPLPSTDPFVFLVPVFLLTFDGTVRGVPTAVVHSLLLTIVTLQNQTKKASILRKFQINTKIKQRHWMSLYPFLWGQIFQDYKKIRKILKSSVLYLDIPCWITYPLFLIYWMK